MLGSASWDAVATVVFAAVTAAATVVLAFMTWKAVTDSRATAEAARDSADASKDSAASARDSVKELAASVAATEEQTRQARLPVLVPAEHNEVPVSITNMGIQTRL